MANNRLQAEDKLGRTLANLALAIDPPRVDAVVGAPPSHEELALFLEQKLDATRRAQIMGFLANDETVYSQWMELVDAMAATQSLAQSNVADIKKDEAAAAESLVDKLKSFFGFGPMGLLGGGLATAAVAVLAVLIVPKQFEQSPMGIDDIYAQWGAPVATQWKRSPKSDKTAPFSVTRSFFSAFKSDEVKVIQAGFYDGAKKLGGQTAYKAFGIELASLNQQADVNTPENKALFEIGQLSALSSLQCQLNPMDEKLEILQNKLQENVKQLQSIQTKDIDKLTTVVARDTDKKQAACIITEVALDLIR